MVSSDRVRVKQLWHLIGGWITGARRSFWETHGEVAVRLMRRQKPPPDTAQHDSRLLVGPIFMGSAYRNEVHSRRSG